MAAKRRNQSSIIKRATKFKLSLSLSLSLSLFVPATTTRKHIQVIFHLINHA